MVSRYPCCSWFRGVSRSRPDMAMMPFMGVRISWLMLARNSALARVAANADLVAHVGQELRLGARCSFRGHPGGQQLTVSLRQVILQVFDPQDRPEPGAEFGWLEGFGQVIHRSKLEPAQLIGRAVPSRED